MFGLAAAVAWGAGDFGGGLVSRRVSVFGVVLVTQLVGMAIAAAIAVIRAEPMPAGQDLLLCIAAGVLGVIGITSLYRGLAVGRMGVVAPVTGVLAAVIPVIAGIILEGWPAQLVLVGIGLAVVAVVLVSRVKDDAATGRSGIQEALLAGLAIGLFGVVISGIGEGFVFSSLTVIRGTQVVILVAALLLLRSRIPWRPPRDALLALVVIGILDMAGNAFYLLGVQTGALAIAAVLSSLYPVTTVILAAVLLKERATRDHAAGIALAIGAIVCIGLGSA